MTVADVAEQPPVITSYGRGATAALSAPEKQGAGREGVRPNWPSVAAPANLGSSAVCVWISAAEEFDQLTALAFRHAANRLRGRDPAAAEEASDPRRTHLWQCEQEILNLRRLRVVGRLGENILDPHSP